MCCPHSNQVWFPWVLPIQEGSYMSRLREARILEHQGKVRC